VFESLLPEQRPLSAQQETRLIHIRQSSMMLDAFLRQAFSEYEAAYQANEQRPSGAERDRTLARLVDSEECLQKAHAHFRDAFVMLRESVLRRPT